jgi:hypothetical protein
MGKMKIFFFFSLSLSLFVCLGLFRIAGTTATKIRQDALLH